MKKTRPWCTVAFELPGVAGGEIEADVADRGRPRPHGDLEQYLVALGPQGHTVQKRPVQGEQPAERVLQGAARGHEKMDQGPARPGHQVAPGPGQPGIAAGPDIAATGDQGRLTGQDRGDQGGQDLGRVLEVGVHDHDHGAPGLVETFLDGTAEAAPPRPGPAVQQLDP